MLTRREFLKGLFGTTLAASAGTAVYASSFNSTDVVFKNIRLACEDLPREFRNYRIVFLTDIHHGPFLPIEWLEASLKILKNSDYDLLVLGGDYICLPESFLQTQIYPRHNQEFNLEQDKTTLAKDIYRAVCSELASLKPADGIIGVLGNHDAWVAPQECMRSFKENNIHMLRNQTFEVKRGTSRFIAHGVEDYWTGFPEVEKNFSNKDFKLLVSHNPDFVKDIEEVRHFDLTLCGHTHAGQICLPGIGGVCFNIEDLRFTGGLYELSNNRYVYTSAGLGVVELPMRINCPPEVTLIELI